MRAVDRRDGGERDSRTGRSTWQRLLSRQLPLGRARKHKGVETAGLRGAALTVRLPATQTVGTTNIT